MLPLHAPSAKLSAVCRRLGAATIRPTRHFVRFLILLLLCPPVSAKLYFYQPPLEVLEPGDVVIDLGIAYSHFDHPDLGEEDRWELPETHVYAQLGRRVMIGADAFVIYRPGDYPENGPPATEEVGLGDVTLSAYVEWLRNPRRGLVAKAFFMGKIPVADDAQYFGTDETDIFWGTTLHWEAARWSASGLARFDVLSRYRAEAGAQWDYLTVSSRVARKLQRGQVFFEGWYRHRDLDRTGLVGLGFAAPLTRTWEWRAYAGLGTNHHYVPSLDSNLEQKVRLTFRRRIAHAGLRGWL